MVLITLLLTIGTATVSIAVVAAVMERYLVLAGVVEGAGSVQTRTTTPNETPPLCRFGVGVTNPLFGFLFPAVVNPFGTFD